MAMTFDLYNHSFEISSADVAARLRVIAARAMISADPTIAAAVVRKWINPPRLALRPHALHPNLAPLVVGRRGAAEMLAISPAKFDELRRAGGVPEPIWMGCRPLWRVIDLVALVDRLAAPGAPSAAESDLAGPNEWDEVLV